MADIGDAETTLILAESVRLFGDEDTDDTADDELTLMRAVRIEKTHPEQRIPHGRARTYSHAAPDLALTFTLSASSDVFQELKDWSSRNSNGVLPTRKWQVRATSVNGTSKTVAFTGALVDWSSSKNLNDQENPVDIEARIRITSDNFTIT